MTALTAPGRGMGRWTGALPAMPALAADPRAKAEHTRARIVMLVIMLPIFGQTFHYMKDLPPLWALSKVFPLVSLPLAAPLLLRERVPLMALWLGVFLWLVVVSSFLGQYSFDQSFFRGLTAQIKLLPMLYFVSFLGFLLLLRPTIGELLTAFAWVGALTFVALLLLWALAPQSWYATTYQFGDAPLLSVDDRGNRIRMPMYFAMITFFALVRRVLGSCGGATAGMSRKAATALAAVALAIVVGVVKTRATVLATAATLAIMAFLAASGRWRIGAVAIAAVCAIGLLQVPYVQSAFDTSSASGFDVRAITVAKASGFLGLDPVRWLFGVGTISSLDPTGLPKFFNHFFFLADISWLGIVFEFGLVGAGLMVLLMVATLAFGVRLRRRVDSPMLAGLQDYVLFVLLMSPLYATMTLQPGEIAVICATFVYCWMIAREAADCDAADAGMVGEMT